GAKLLLWQLLSTAWAVNVNTAKDRPMKGSLTLRVLVALLLAITLAAPQRLRAADTPIPYAGLLRGRDLTPFGFLRLDMRPAHAVSGEPGNWGIETDLGYQNTWALSPATEEYLSKLPGRHALGPADYAAIQALPGENYLIDLELAQLDVTFSY